MNLKVTHLEHASDTFRWALRFTGAESDFNEIRLVFKALGRPAITWSPSYKWKHGKPGAWLITGRQLDKVLYHFDNLESEHTSSHEGNNIVHMCAFWLEDMPKDRTLYKELEPA